MTKPQNKVRPMLRRPLATAAIALMAGMFAPEASAVASTDPAAFIGAFGNQLHTVASNASPSRRRAEFRRLFRADFDVAGLGRFVLGRYWRVFTAPEQQQFLCLFENYVVLTFSDERLSQYVADGAVPRVTGSRPDPDGVTVSTQIARGAVKPIEVDWRLTAYDGGYKISDVVIDGLSMAANGRSELEGVVARNGGQAQAILAVLQQQIAGDSVSPPPDRCSPVPMAQPRALASADAAR